MNRREDKGLSKENRIFSKENHQELMSKLLNGGNNKTNEASFGFKRKSYDNGSRSMTKTPRFKGCTLEKSRSISTNRGIAPR